MRKKIKKIYYSEELPKLYKYNYIIDVLKHKFGLCYLINPTKNNGFSKYYEDWDNDLIFLGEAGIWNEERLNLICLLIHSLNLED